ncbi:MAG: hypothetical protein HRU19_12550 [Pseudobacteriovorax sp.]|nr:hypothetical protein [Pseudobacteriovorax sp.]
MNAFTRLGTLALTLASGTTFGNVRDFTTFSFSQVAPRDQVTFDVQTLLGSQRTTINDLRSNGESSFYSLSGIYRLSTYLHAGLEYQNNLTSGISRDIFTETPQVPTEISLNSQKERESIVTGFLGFSIPVARGRFLFSYSLDQTTLEEETINRFYNGATLTRETREESDFTLRQHRFGAAFRQGNGLLGADFAPSARTGNELDRNYAPRLLMLFANANIMSNMQLGASATQLRYDNLDAGFAPPAKDYNIYKIATHYRWSNKFVSTQLAIQDAPIFNTSDYQYYDLSTYIGMQASRDLEVGARLGYNYLGYKQETLTVLTRTTGLGLEARFQM